jgi:aryl-alcohol dehydrogenase-like predicted oxidoreductase
MTVGVRTVAGTSVHLSELTFGSMRMNGGRSASHWNELLIASIEAGITTCHSSDEYDSFSLFCSVLDGLRRDGMASRLQHIVKLAEPHFGKDEFDERRLRRRVEQYLTSLRVARLDIVQWMWRGDLERERARLSGFTAQRHSIREAFASLRREGKVAAVLPFPYTVAFAEEVLADDAFDGLTVYLNPVELDYEPFAGRKPIISLRPLAAGRALDAGYKPAAAIEWALAHPKVVTTVVSYSSPEHLKELSARQPPW